MKITVDVTVSKLAEQRIKQLKNDIRLLRIQLYHAQAELRSAELHALTDALRSEKPATEQAEINRDWDRSEPGASEQI